MDIIRFVLKSNFITFYDAVEACIFKKIFWNIQSLSFGLNFITLTENKKNDSTCSFKKL